MTQSAPPPATHGAPPPVTNASAPQQKPAKPPPPATAVSVNIMRAGQKDQKLLNVESFDTADLLRNFHFFSLPC